MRENAMKIESDRWPCAGRRWWVGLPVPKGRLVLGWSRHKWEVADARVESLHITGQTLYTLEVTCVCCGLSDEAKRTNLPELMLENWPMRPAAIEALGLKEKVAPTAVSFVSPDGLVNHAAVSSAIVAAKEEPMYPITLQPGESHVYQNPVTGSMETFHNDSGHEMNFALPYAARRGGGFGRLMRAAGLVATAPMRYPLRAAKAYAAKVKADQFQWLWGPLLVSTCLSALGGLGYGIYHDKVVECAQGQFAGLVEEVTPLDGNYIMVRFRGGPAFKVYTDTGKPMPVAGIGGRVCKNGHFHVLESAPEQALEVESEDF
jgi:hypothetical protein